MTVGTERYTFVFSMRRDAWHRECFPLMFHSPGAASWIPQASCCKDRAPFSSMPHAPSHPGVPSHSCVVRMGSLEPAFALRGAYRLGFLSALRWAFWFMKAHCSVLFTVWPTLTNRAPGPRVSRCRGVSSQYTSRVTSHSSHAKGSFYNCPETCIWKGFLDQRVHSERIPRPVSRAHWPCFTDGIAKCGSSHGALHKRTRAA